MQNSLKESSYLYHAGVRNCGCGLPEGVPVGEQDESTQIHHRQLPLVSLISKLFVLHYRLESKPEVYLIMRHYVGEYLGQCLQNAEPVELFSCWNGDERLLVEKHSWITLQDLLVPEFYFEERQLTVVYKDQNSLQAAKGGIHPVDSDG